MRQKATERAIHSQLIRRELKTAITAITYRLPELTRRRSFRLQRVERSEGGRLYVPLCMSSSSSVDHLKPFHSPRPIGGATIIGQPKSDLGLSLGNNLSTFHHSSSNSASGNASSSSFTQPISVAAAAEAAARGFFTAQKTATAGY